MKATLFAAVLSLSAASLPVFASAPESQAKTSTQQITQKINLNTADVSHLTGVFKGIGKKRAEAIVNYREKHGKFTSVSELAEVRGLGKSFVNTHLAELQAVFSTN